MVVRTAVLPAARAKRQPGREQLRELDRAGGAEQQAATHVLYNVAVLGLIGVAQVAWLGLLGYEAFRFVL